MERHLSVGRQFVRRNGRKRNPFLNNRERNYEKKSEKTRFLPFLRARLRSREEKEVTGGGGAPSLQTKKGVDFGKRSRGGY